MEIYADVLFFINFISSYVMINLTGRITGTKLSIKRNLSGATVAGLVSVISFSSNESGIIKLVGAIVIVCVSFGVKGINTVIRFVVFEMMSLSFTAIFAFISSINKSEIVKIRNGTMYFDIPVMKFLFLFTVSYFLISLALFIIRRKKQYVIKNLEIEFCGKTVRLSALYDSGNMLKEPITGKDVIVVEWEKVKALFDDITYPEFKNNMEKYKLWLIPYRSLGNNSGIITAFLADTVKVKEENVNMGKTFIAVTEDKLSIHNEYDALIGAVS